jgi:NADPH:quinone reductase
MLCAGRAATWRAAAGKPQARSGMQGWSVAEYGAYRDVLRYGEVPRPEPGPGAALVRVRAAGVSFAQTLRIAGTYQIRDPLPFTPGTDAAGEVVAAGADCPFQPGQRMMGSAPNGAYAEYAVLPASGSSAVPDGMPSEDAAAFINAYQTAYAGVVYQGRLKPGEVLLVHGAAGGVGLAAVQLGHALGATVIATAGSAEKLAACRAQGAQLAIDYTREDFVPAVLEHTHGHGADIIYDPVGGDVFDKSRRCIAFDGRLVVVGFASGRIPEIAANRMLLRTFSVSGFTLHGYKTHRPDLLAAAQAHLFRLYAQGALKPVISQRLPLARLVEALELVERRKVIGKVVLVPDDAA